MCKRLAVVAILTGALGSVRFARAQSDPVPPVVDVAVAEPIATAPPTKVPERDTQERDAGAPTSRFAMYARSREFLLEPSFEYRQNNNYEYDAAELGFEQIGGKHHGRYQALDGNFLVAYGIGGWATAQVETHVLRASLEKESNDASIMPDRVTRSGLGEVRARTYWRWFAERDARPELYSFVGYTFPHDRTTPLVGTPESVGSFGSGVVKGFGSGGTVVARVSGEYDLSSGSPLDWGEYALEYHKRIVPTVNVVLAYVSFGGDEASFGGELQWSPTERVTLKAGHRIAVVSHLLSATSNSTDFAPSASLLVRFP